MAKKQEWIRTGGAQGDQTMSELDEFNATGCGIKEVCKEAPHEGSDPNEGVMLDQIEGAE